MRTRRVMLIERLYVLIYERKRALLLCHAAIDADAAMLAAMPLR